MTTVINQLILVMTVSLISGVLMSAHADIYQTTDEKGVTLFTDQPDKMPNKEQATKVDIGDVSTVPAYHGGHEAQWSSGTSDNQLRQSKQAKQKKSAPVSYKLRMVSPLPDSTYRRGVGSVDVSAAVLPALQSGHQMILKIDGQPIEGTMSASYPTTKLYRGSHVASAAIVDSEGRNLGSASVTFYVHQTSKIIQDKRKAEEKRKREAALPWWKRQINKINITL